MPSISESESVLAGGSAIRIERILCPVDFSEVSAKAYRYAQSIACHYRAKLILQHVVELRYSQLDYIEEFPQALLTDANEALRQFVELYGVIEPECVVEKASPADAILALADSRAANLVVMGTHGRRGFDHLILGSVTERVLRHAPCPVLAVPGKHPDESGKSPEDGSVPVQRVLCCVDFSAHSQRALDHALSVTNAYGADLVILHVMEHISESANVSVETDVVVGKLQEMLPRSAIAPARLHFEVRLGQAYREILDFATANHSDLIVMGVRGRNSLDLAVFGSTTYRVIQLHSGPVLTVAI
jgi:nucleotide-binding universal stress UspA family protein